MNQNQAVLAAKKFECDYIAMDLDGTWYGYNVGLYNSLPIYISDEWYNNNVAMRLGKLRWYNTKINTKISLKRIK